MALRKDDYIQEPATALGNAVTGWLVNLNPADLFITCASCANMAPDRKTCQQFNAVPPCDIVVTGCEQYVDGTEIPF
jgi:hypothetical protein